MTRPINRFLRTAYIDMDIYVEGTTGYPLLKTLNHLPSTLSSL